MRDRLMLEYPEKMCEYCSNFDKEHIGMDGTALCKLTMTLAYAEDYGGNCMFYNVPKEQIIVPPCKAGDFVYYVDGGEVFKDRVIGVIYSDDLDYLTKSIRTYDCLLAWDNFGKTYFATKEEAEAELVKRSKTNA